MFDPPPGFTDMLSDAEDAPEPTGPYHPLVVDGVGTIRARKPSPAAIPLLAMMSSGSSDPADYLARFLQHHTPPGWFEDMLAKMIADDELADDALQRCVKTIATAGTARPYLAVVNLAVIAAYHWRMFRARYHSQGIHDPMSIGSMHAILDDVETVAVESAARDAKTSAEAKAKVSQFYDQLYAPDLSHGAVNKAGAPPPGFTPEELEASFDAFAGSVSAAH